MMKNQLLLLFFLLSGGALSNCLGQVNNNKYPNELKGCHVSLTDDILTIENAFISRRYQWNNGDIKSLSIIDKQTNHQWKINNTKPDAIFPNSSKPSNGKLEVHQVAATTINNAYLEAECITDLGALKVKRVFRIYPRCPAIACTFYLRGSIGANWGAVSKNQGDLQNVETISDNKKSAPGITVMQQLALPGHNWYLKAVQFFDTTDQNNNLVQTYDQLPYRADSRLIGNLLFANEGLTDNGIFILKEAPTSSVQLNYPGFDFIASITNLQTVGIGVLPQDIDKEKWLRCYGFVTGVTSGGELGQLLALRIYQEQVRKHLPGRDDMILMNTWGDRSQDKHIGEKFTLNELQAAHRLGITHFQIDDGWQTGRSSASVFGGGSLNNIWANPNYWKPDKIKFPNGLLPLTQLAEKLGIKLCLWFNPSKDSSYAHWRDDAKALIDLYRMGINTFKIDGVQVMDKKGEINLRSMFDTVISVSHNQVIFNLDVTAGRRYGYHYFNEYGNLFLENRYTDWGNYYPHWTLRNLWMLARYVPPQNLQIEFLNNFRNVNKYAADDVLAPSKVSFEYGFAITMMAQPLAWMEATGLPEKAFSTAPVIKKYQTIQSDIHKGKIFPIGNEPSGMSWTGFQSIKSNNTGYLLVIRENNKNATGFLQTWLPPGKKVKLTVVLGSGKSGIIAVNHTGGAFFKLPQKNEYALYSYKIL